MLQRRGDRAGSADAFAKASQIRQEKADGQAALFAINTGMEKLKANDAAAAVAPLREAVRLAPKNAQAHYQLALALARTGAREEARAHVEEARRLAPDLVPPDAP